MMMVQTTTTTIAVALLLLSVPSYTSCFTLLKHPSSTSSSNMLSSINNGRVGTGSTSTSFALGARRTKNSKGNAADADDADDDSNVDSAKRAALDGIMNQIERSYGRGSIINLGDDSENSHNLDIKCTSSGAISLDMALGGSGYPKGRIVEIYGPESSGKTTLALHAIAEAQKNDSNSYCAFVDAEHALDPVYAEKCGVKVNQLLISQPDSGEMALDIVDQLVRSAAVDVIVVDSVAALVPRAELEGDMSDMQIGLQARLMSKALRKICGSLSLSQCTVIFLNQLRSKVGVIYGSPEVTSGGNALKFYSSIRLDCRRREILSQNQGIKIKVKVVKNKIAPPFETVELDILFGSGIDQVGCLVDSAENLGILIRKGSWYYNKSGENLAQGRSNVIYLLKQNNNALAKELEIQVRKSLFGETTGDESEQDDDDDDSIEDKDLEAKKQQLEKELSTSTTEEKEGESYLE